MISSKLRNDKCLSLDEMRYGDWVRQSNASARCATPPDISIERLPRLVRRGAREIILTVSTSASAKSREVKFVTPPSEPNNALMNVGSARSEQDTLSSASWERWGEVKSTLYCSFDHVDVVLDEMANLSSWGGCGAGVDDEGRLNAVRNDD